MIAWIAPFAGGVVLLAVAWFASTRPVALRIGAAVLAALLLALAWMQFQRWEQVAGEPSLFQRPDRAAQRQAAARLDPVMPEAGAVLPASPPADDEPFFPESADNPFAPVAPLPEGRAAGSEELWPSELALDAAPPAVEPQPAAQAPEAPPSAEPAPKRPAPAPRTEPAPAAAKPVPRTDPAPAAAKPAPAAAAPERKTEPVPRRARSAPRSEAHRPAPPPAPERHQWHWRSSEEVIAATPPIREPAPDPARVSSPLRGGCALGGDGAAGGICVLVENRLGPDQYAERLQLFIEGRPVGVLDVDPSRPVARLPIRFSHPGRFGYRLIGERQTPRGRERINSTGVLIARDGLVYAVRAAPDAPRVFLEIEPGVP